jgi:hypothetical protein
MKAMGNSWLAAEILDGLLHCDLTDRSNLSRPVPVARGEWTLSGRVRRPL